MADGTIKVGHIEVDGKEIRYRGPGFPAGVKWMHALPESYDHKNLKNSHLACFTDTSTGKAAMKAWLKDNGLQRIFENSNSAYARVSKYLKTPSFKKDQAEIYKILATKLDEASGTYVKELGKHDLHPADPDLISKLANPMIVLQFLACSPCAIVYACPNFCRDVGYPLTADEVMVLGNPTYIPNLGQIPWKHPPPPPPPPESWSGKIASARVICGCLRLFSGINYMGVVISLWGPDMNYPDIGDFGFRAKSLIQI